MIPVRLKMHNFMSYRGDVPPFDFHGIHTACICGSNGAGKSTLIDAMTWALWGKTRAKSDDDLIYLGENATTVTFDFSIDKNSYRIVRKHERPKKSSASGQSSLDLYIQDGESLVTITADNKTLTQQKIIDILHLDYETFINSAFIRQGHAAEFTEQRPAKRKEVLASILELSQYDALEEKAKEMSRGFELEKEKLLSVNEEIDKELENLPTVEAEIEEAKKQVSALSQDYAKCESSLLLKQKGAEALRAKNEQLVNTREYISQADADRNKWLEIKAQTEGKIKSHKELISKKSEISKGYKEYLEARKMSEELYGKQRSFSTLSQKRHELTRAIDISRSKLDSELGTIKYKINTLKDSPATLEKRSSQLEELRIQTSGLSEQEAGINTQKLKIQSLRDEISKAAAEINSLRNENKVTEEKCTLLSSDTSSKCPVCEKSLDGGEKEKVLGKYAKEKEQNLFKINEISAIMNQNQRSLRESEFSLNQLEKGFKTKSSELSVKEKVLKEEIIKLKENTRELKEASGLLKALEENLEQGGYAASEQAELAATLKEIEVLNYDAAEHDALNSKLKELEHYDTENRRVEEAERLIEQEYDSVKKAEATITDLEQRQEKYETLKNTLLKDIEALPALERELNLETEKLNSLKAENDKAKELLGALNNRITHLKNAQDKKEKAAATIKDISEKESIYKELAVAFGKRGIQAILIETAIPEIENEANRLLAKMTENRMHIAFVTQKQRKSGAVSETLEIIISDELGTRNYEMYSGGEAFRIDFAVRIALSKLLTKRAGAPLPTLIIDEGFGTQDAMGIERLKEAINSIQDDFDKIFVITHIEELKDAFPMRIEVTKTADGSRIALG